MVANTTNKRDHIIFGTANRHNDFSHVRSWIFRRLILARFFIEAYVEPSKLRMVAGHARRHDARNSELSCLSTSSPAALDGESRQQMVVLGTLRTIQRFQPHFIRAVAFNGGFICCYSRMRCSSSEQRGAGICYFGRSGVGRGDTAGIKSLQILLPDRSSKGNINFRSIRGV